MRLWAGGITRRSIPGTPGAFQSAPSLPCPRRSRARRENKSVKRPESPGSASRCYWGASQPRMQRLQARERVWCLQEGKAGS